MKTWRHNSTQSQTLQQTEMNNRIHARWSLLSREESKVLVAGFLLGDPGSIRTLQWTMFLRSRQFYFISDHFTNPPYYHPSTSDAVGLDQGCPTGGSICKLIWGAARKCDDFHIVVLINYVEYNKHKNSRSIGSKLPLNIRLLHLKKFRLLVGPPGIKCIPVVMILHYHNCTKHSNFPRSCSKLVSVEFYNVVTIRDQRARQGRNQTLTNTCCGCG